MEVGLVALILALLVFGGGGAASPKFIRSLYIATLWAMLVCVLLILGLHLSGE